MINFKKILYLFFFVGILFQFQDANATGLDQVLAGDEVEDFLGKSQATAQSPYIIQNEENLIENQKLKYDVPQDYMFNEKIEEVSVKENSKNNLEDLGYTLPGSFETKENYTEIDKKEMGRRCSRCF